MNRSFCDALTRFRVGWSALVQVVRLVVVLALFLVADIAFPDFDRTIFRTEAAPYTVTYDTQGGNSIPSATWSAGSSITLPTPTRAGYTFKGWSTRSAGSQLVYQTTTPTRSGNNIVYTAGYGKGGSDAAATLTNQGATFNRVRYRMEANYNGTLRFADVSFDAWSQGLAISQLAVPDLGDARVIKTNVSNLFIASNWPASAGTATAVTTGSGKSGRLELWPWDYSTYTTGILPAGNGSIYDYDDANNGNSVYGSFQVHNLTDLQTVFAWNKHFDSSPDIGFGNYLGSSNSDWTFASNTLFNLATWKLQIFIGDEFSAGTAYTPTTADPVTFYAQWTPNTYTVSYNYNSATGGNSVASASYTSGNSALTLPTPTRTNYTFEGWYSDSGFTSFVGNGGASYTPTSTGTLYAKWMTNQAAFSLTGAPSTLGYQASVTVATSGGSGAGGVVFATTSPGVCTVNANTGAVTMVAATGTCNLVATKAADNSYYATSANASISAVKGTQAVLTVSGSSSAVYGATVTLSTSGGTTNAPIVWSAGSSTACTIDSSGVVSISAGTGSCSVTATMAGNSNYDSVSSNAFAITVSRASQSTLTVTTTEATFGQTLSLGATGGSGTGALSWDRVSGVCTLSGATLTPSTVGSSCVVKATKAADGNYSARSTSDTSITTVRAPQVGFAITNASTFETGTPLSLTAAGGQSGGSISWSVVSGPCTVSGTSLASTRGGVTCVVTATRAASANYLAATDTATITVTKIVQTLTFQGTVPSSATVGTTYTVNVSSSAFLSATIAVANQSQSVCSVSAGVVSFLSPGSCLISVSQGGDDSYTSAAISQTISVVSAPAPTTVPPSTSSTVAPASVPSPSTTIPATTVPPSQTNGSSTTSSTTSTTTTTTTLPPNPGAAQLNPDGSSPDLSAGQSTAFVRGKKVAVKVQQVKETLVVSLPNKVKVTFGRRSGNSESIPVASDGVLRAFHQEIVDVFMVGLTPGTTYTVYMFSTPVELGRGEVQADGSVNLSLEIPKGSTFGEHTLQVNGVGPKNELVSLSMGIEVLERESNLRLVVLVMSAAILLALLGGRPLFKRRRQ